MRNWNTWSEIVEKQETFDAVDFINEPIFSRVITRLWRIHAHVEMAQEPGQPGTRSQAAGLVDSMHKCHGSNQVSFR